MDVFGLFLLDRRQMKSNQSIQHLHQFNHRQHAHADPPANDKELEVILTPREEHSQARLSTDVREHVRPAQRRRLCVAVHKECPECHLQADIVPIDVSTGVARPIGWKADLARVILQRIALQPLLHGHPTRNGRRLKIKGVRCVVVNREGLTRIDESCTSKAVS